MSYTPNADGLLAFPALVDCHVHFRQPGLEHKGDMRSEGEAAHYGGVSVVCDMPNTKPPTNTVALLQAKVELAETTAAATRADGVHAPTRMFFFLGATEQSHLDELRVLWTAPAHAHLKQHCCGLKLYLDNSTGNLKSSAAVTAAAFALCGELDIPLVAHCEQAEINTAAAELHPYDKPAAHSQRRPPESEEASVDYAIELARKHRTPLHIAHLSTAGGLACIRAARAADPTLRLTCEVTPHHLFLSTADYPCSCCGGWLKVNPPVRDRQPHVEALWAGLLDGTIDCVGTDHAPHALEEKAITSGEPPSGLPSIEVVVPLLLTVASGGWPQALESFVPTHGDATPKGPAPMPAVLADGKAAKRLSYEDIVRVMHTNPNRIFRLGLDNAVDRTFNVRKAWAVQHAQLHSKHNWSPYDGWKLVGKPVV